jgi:hypothetical protein
MKCLLLMLIAFSTSNLYSQSVLDQLKDHLKSIDSTIVSIELDTLESAKSDFNGLSLLRSGKFKGVLTIVLDENSGFRLLVYSSEDDSAFRKEVETFHMHASCRGRDYNNVDLYMRGGYYFFLPMYPCWTIGYTGKGKKILSELLK